MTTPEDTATPGNEAVVPGTRFTAKCDERAHLPRLHPHRLWRWVVGLALLAFGIVNIFIPGPGGSVIILAALLVLAGESRLLARVFDWAEVRFQPQIRWAMAHKLTAMLIISGCAFIAVMLMGVAYTRLRG